MKDPHVASKPKLFPFLFMFAKAAYGSLNVNQEKAHVEAAALVVFKSQDKRADLDRAYL